MKATIQGADWRPDPQNPDGPSIETVEVLQAFSVLPTSLAPALRSLC
jgi:hypothetical protein